MSGIIGQLLIGSGVIGELQGRGFNSRTNMLAAVARKKASGFVYSSTGFNGSTFMDATDPIPDGKTGLFSVWMKLDSGTSDAADYYLTANAAYGFYFGRTAAGVFSLTLAGVGTIVSNVSVLKGAWHHIASSWDAATNTKYQALTGSAR